MSQSKRTETSDTKLKRGNKNLKVQCELINLYDTDWVSHQSANTVSHTGKPKELSDSESILNISLFI